MVSEPIFSPEGVFCEEFLPESDNLTFGRPFSRSAGSGDRSGGRSDVFSEEGLEALLVSIGLVGVAFLGKAEEPGVLGL
jgi:hypothetical protein